MPVYKQYKYRKTLDCLHCKFYKFNECKQPDKKLCCYITTKKWNKTYYFKTSIYSRTFIRRGFHSKEAAREAETDFRRNMLGIDLTLLNGAFPTYTTLLKEYQNYLLSQFKETYAHKVNNTINFLYMKLFPDSSINKLLTIDADNARKKIDEQKINCDSKNRHLNFLKRFFKYVHEKYHYRFDAIFLLPPFKDYEIKRIKPKKEIVTFSQFEEIYTNCDDSYYRLALLTLFLFGFRLGELLALSVDSFNFESSTIEIYKNVSFKEGGGKRNFTLTTPKTKASERIVLAPEHYMKLVKEHIELYSLKDNDFIFFRRQIDDRTVPVHENTFRRSSDIYCRKFNPDFHPHMLRSSICTHLRDKGVSIDEVSALLGHKNTRITDEIYSKRSEEKTKVINQKINEFLEGIVSN